MKLPVTLITLALLNLVGSLNVQAENLEYDFSVVIFEDTSNQYINSEKWESYESLQLSRDKAINDSTPANTAGINISDIKTDMLDNQISKLKTTSRYKILVQKSWRQTGLDAESAVDIHIDSTSGTVNGTPGYEYRSSIEGTIKVILGRYLHMYFDMIYRKPGNNTVYKDNAVRINNNVYEVYRIKSHRRMRSNELHYIDHPLVGILVMAQPVEPAEMPEVVNKPEQSPKKTPAKPTSQEEPVSPKSLR